jgi:hypothetical protein
MVNKKNFGSVFIITFLVISLAVVLFFSYGLMTGNVTFTDSTASWYGDKILGDNDVYEFIFPSGVSLTSVSVSWSDNSGTCNGFIERNTSSGWQIITEKPEVSNALSVFTFNNINIADKEFRVKVEGCQSKKMNITKLETVFKTTTWSCFNYTYSAWSSCNSAGNRTRTNLSKVLSSCDTGFSAPDLTQKCCLNYTYSAWSSCNSTGQKIKSNISQNFMACPATNVNRIVVENCLCGVSNWTDVPTSCNGGLKNITWTKIGNCTGGTPSPANQTNVPCGTSATCSGAGMFCLNTTPAHSSNVTELTCPGLNEKCYNCSAGFSWNETLKVCQANCGVQPGCGASFANASIVSGYCSTGSCLKCDNNFIYNNSKCELMQCESSVGCLNLTSLSNANNLTRNCSVGKICFACNSGYNWNNASCVLGAGAWVNTTLTDAEFLAGTIKNMQVYERVYFTVGSVSYWLGLISVNSTIYTADIQIGSIVNKTLVINSEAKVDLNGDGILDISILLDDVYDGEADISIKKIVTSAGQSGTPVDNSATANMNQDETSSLLNNTGTSGAGTQTESPGALVWVIIGLFILIIMVVAAIYLKLRKSEPPRVKPFFVPADVSQSTTQFRPVNQSSIPVSRQQATERIVSPVGVQKPVVNIAVNSDAQVVADIRKQLVSGNQFISVGNFSSAKEIYSKISQTYKKLIVSNRDLYSEIVGFYNKIPK